MNSYRNATSSTEISIDASGSVGELWRDLWRYRSLLYFLTWRDILVRYKQTVIGVAWAVLPAILTTLIFSIVFGKFAHLSSDGAAYPVFVLAGTLPWGLFSSALSQSGNSLLANSHLISKVYFPRMIVPLSALLVSLVDFLTSAVVLAALMLVYRVAPGIRLCALPLFLLLVLGAALGVGLWLSALNVRYRDVRYVIPFLVQLGLYLSPVGFSSHVVPARYQALYALNPMVGVINGFRWSLLGASASLDWTSVILAAGVVAILLVSGLIYFRKVETTFADVI
ncbi:MAG TPA: ABC transporter permease [Elusimicrobiota bacterium]|nr:ABC transporter permease [Elusimicrobiota bacterium]